MHLHLRLELVPRVADDEGQSFELNLMGAIGTVIMTFALPGNISRELAANDEEWQIIMSPSGSVEVYNDDNPPQRRLKIALDELIGQNLTPDMLEDEPDLRVQLIALKRKLTASLALVDQTLATLDKDQP
jgi:hypothetical protein